jgi:hypothetical protein
MHYEIESTLHALGDFVPVSKAAAKELLAGPLESARQGLIGELTSAGEALRAATESGTDACNVIAAVERTRLATEWLGARAFFAHEFLHETDEHPDALVAGEVCALAQEVPCDEMSAREYLEYVGEILSGLTAMKTAA